MSASTARRHAAGTVAHWAVASLVAASILTVCDVAHAKARFEGPFLSFGPGFALQGGSQGVKIANPTAGTAGSEVQLDKLDADKYARAVRNDKGGGIGLDLQFGYNIKGFVSLSAELGWHGSLLGEKLDTAGVGAATLFLGLHPLRFWRDDLDVDLRLYGGYGVYEINHYNEDGTQAAIKGKSWTGNNITAGGAFLYRLPESAVAFGLDVRHVMGRYTAWVYNFDKGVESAVDPPAEKDRLQIALLISLHL